MQDKNFLKPDAVTVTEYSVADFDKSIVDLGISLTSEAVKAVNTDHKLKLVEAIVKLRGALPPIYSIKSK